MCIRRTVTSSSEASPMATLHEPVTFEDLCSLGTGVIAAMPTISSSQFDDLKFDNGRLRLWASRMRASDYDGDMDAYARERFVVEELQNGRWVRLGCACPLATCVDERRRR